MQEVDQHSIALAFIIWTIWRFVFVEKPSDEKADEKAEEKPEKEPLTENAAENEQAPPAKKHFSLKIPAIRLPQLPNLIPKRLRSNNQQTEDLELGNGPNNKAGLASMETLDDSIKDNETNKDVTDKAAVTDEGLETVKVSRQPFAHLLRIELFSL